MNIPGEVERRRIVNDYFNKPKDETKKQFCKTRNIKCYQLNRMIEIYGQRIEPELKEIAKAYTGLTPSGQRFNLIDTWCEETRKLVAVELSDKEYPEYLRNEYNNTLSVRFDRTRLKVIVEIVMLSRTQQNLSKLVMLYRELCEDDK